MDAFGIVVAIVVATVVFFMIRDILCWYWKIDTIIEKLDTILGELTDLDEISRKLTNLDEILGKLTNLDKKISRKLTDLDEISRKLTNLDDISENRDGK